MKRVIKNILFLLKSLLPSKYQLPKILLQQYQFLQESKKWDLKHLREYQWHELKKLLNYAYCNSPYYKKLFSEHSINLNHIKNFKDFSQKVPILSKNEIRHNLERLVTLPKNKLARTTTGGTIGKPLEFYLEKNVTYNKTLAFEWRHYNSGGYFFNDKIVTLRGNTIKDNIYEHHKEKHCLFLSAFDMTKENMHKYVKLIEKYQPKYIAAYASAAEILANFVSEYYPYFNKNGQIKSLFATSETLYDYQKNIIEKAFNLKVFDKYGNSEQCTIIGQCQLRKYHDYMEYSYSEFLDENNEEVKNGQARLVSTSFVNYATPFIRYETGDIVEIERNDKCDCGMQHTVIKRIIGREKETIIDKKGNEIALGPILFGIHDQDWGRIKRIQFVQDKMGYLILKVVSNEKEEWIYKYIKSLFDRRLTLFEYKIKIVNDIKLTGVGKHKYLIQNLNLKDITNKQIYQR